MVQTGNIQSSPPDAPVLSLETYTLKALLDDTVREFLSDDHVENINIDRPKEMWVEYSGGKREVYEMPNLTLDRIERLANEIATSQNIDYHSNEQTISTKLSDGSRIEINLSSAVMSGVCMAIRKRRAGFYKIKDFGFTEKEEAKIIDFIKNKKTIIVSGSTSSGKTSLIDAMQMHIETTRRIVTIQDPVEIDFHVPCRADFHVTQTLKEKREIQLADLQSSAMRINPDSIIIGEIRERYFAYCFYQMINTGHDGSMTTIHSNEGTDNAIQRLTSLVLEYTNGDFLRTEEAIRNNIDMFIHVQKTPSGRVGTIQTK